MYKGHGALSYPCTQSSGSAVVLHKKSTLLLRKSFPHLHLKIKPAQCDELLLSKAPPNTHCQLMYHTCWHKLRVRGCCIPCVEPRPQQGSTRSLAWPGPACPCMHRSTICPGEHGQLHSRPDAQPHHTPLHRTAGSHSCMTQTLYKHNLHTRTHSHMHARRCIDHQRKHGLLLQCV